MLFLLYNKNRIFNFLSSCLKYDLIINISLSLKKKFCVIIYKPKNKHLFLTLTTETVGFMKNCLYPIIVFFII